MPVASPPPHPRLNHAALVMARGDIKANETKTTREPETATARVQLWVTEADALEAASAAEIAVVVRGDVDAEPVRHTETAKI